MCESLKEKASYGKQPSQNISVQIRLCKSKMMKPKKTKKTKKEKENIKVQLLMRKTNHRRAVSENVDHD